MSSNLFKNEPAGQNKPGACARIQTKPVKVLVTTDDYEIEGNIHIRPGGYKARISDILNIKDQQFIPITDVVFHKVDSPDEPPRRAETMLVRVDTIKTVIPVGECQ